MKFKPKVIEVALKKCTIYPSTNKYYGEFTPVEALYLFSMCADLGLHHKYYEDKFKACTKTGTCFIRGTMLIWFTAPRELIELIKKYDKSQSKN